MTHFNLKVTASEPNPNYEEEKEHYDRYSRSFAGAPNEPRERVVRTTLEVELTEEQWEAVRTAVLQQFK